MSPINIYYAFEKSKIWKHQCKRLIPRRERDPNIANHYASCFIILHFHSSIGQEIHKPDSTKIRRIEHKRKVIGLLMPYIVLIKSEYFSSFSIGILI